MARFLLIAPVLFLLFGCVNTQPDDGSVSSDLLPLAVGNNWKYAREYFYRGTRTERDTVVVTVVGVDTSGGRTLWNVRWDAPDLLETIQLIQYSESEYQYRRMGDSTFMPIISASFPLSVFLRTHSLGASQHNEYSHLKDTSYRDRTAMRIREHVDLLREDGSVAVFLEFDHAFVRGIGQVYARFVSDITQCLFCNRKNEFWIYELTEYKVQ